MRLEGNFTAEEHYERISEMVTMDEKFFRGLRIKLRAALNETEERAPRGLDVDDNSEIATVLRDINRLLTTQYGLQMVTLIEDGG